MSYSKPWRSYDEQLDLLISRGLTVTDRTRALEYLERIGYYRLSGYLHSFRERSGMCCPLEKQAQRRKFEIVLKNRGIKKPLSNEPAEASPPKGAVLLNIIGRSPKNSNFLVCQGETYE